MSGAENQGDYAGSFLDQLLKPSMPQPRPQVRAMPVAPGTPAAQQASPVQQGAMTSALPTVRAGQGQSIPLPPQYVPPPANMTDELETVGAQSGGIPWMQILGAALAAGGGGAIIDAMSRGGGAASPTGTAPDMPPQSRATLPAPDTALQGEVIPPTQQRIAGTNPEPPTIDATKRSTPAPAQQALPTPGPVNQLDEVLRPQLTQAPALPPAAIPLKDANNASASLPSQTQQGGMPQMASGEQAKVDKYYGDSSVPNTSKSPSFDQNKTSRVETVINEELSRRGLSMEDLPTTAQNRLKDGNFIARAGSGADKLEALRKFIRGLKVVR